MSVFGGLDTVSPSYKKCKKASRTTKASQAITGVSSSVQNHHVDAGDMTTPLTSLMQILRGTVGKAPPYSTQDHRDHGQLQQPEEKEGAKKAVLEDKQDQEQLRQPEEKLVSWSGRCAKQVALKDENPQEQRRQSEQQMSKLEHEVISLKTRLKELEGQVSQSRRLCEIEDRLLIVRMEQKRLGLEEKQLEKEQQQLQLCLGQSGQLAEGAKDWMTYLTL